jgi:hypothetical protein
LLIIQKLLSNWINCSYVYSLYFMHGLETIVCMCMYMYINKETYNFIPYMTPACLYKSNETLLGLSSSIFT